MILFPHGRPNSPETFDEYRAAGGYRPISANILEEISASGLRGRGGAGFPAGRKWAIAAQTAAEARYVVCNAGEDEPGSFKDRVLLEYRPHLVLEGMILAAHAISAYEAILYLNETYDVCLSKMTAAINEADAEGYLGGITVRIHPAPRVYVAGEDTAALEVIEGKPAKPRLKPPYPATSGLYGMPTVVNNVETLANVPLIARNGAAWFRSHGTSGSPGTMIFCLHDEMVRPGAVELPFGTTLRHLYETAGGGLTAGRKLKAVLPGPSSAFLVPEQLDIPLDPESFKKAGSLLGCGVIRFY
jgi:NADH-quinone oxidoreductase subunit F